MTFEEIKKANDTISTMGIERKDKKTGKVTVKEYAEVNQRIKAFRMLQPNGSIETELISLDGDICIFRAVVKNEDGKILGTGTAFEDKKSSFINNSSFIENCETSSIGRALAMCGIGIDLSVASYEEVANAKLNQNEGNNMLPIINDVEEIKPGKKVSERLPQPKAEPQMPSREELLRVALNHFPKGSDRYGILLKSNNLADIEEASDVQLLAIYNKFGGK